MAPQLYPAGAIAQKSTVVSNCPVCEDASCTENLAVQFFPGALYDCPRCGKFELVGTLKHRLPTFLTTTPRRAVMSHRLRCLQQPDGNPIKVYESDLSGWRLDDPLPSPAEQADRLIVLVWRSPSITGAIR